MPETTASPSVEEEKKAQLRADDILNQEVVLAWQAFDSFHHERSPAWYLWASLAAVFMVIFAIFTQAWTLAVAVAVLAGVIYLLAQEPPGVVEVIVTRMGIHVNKNFYPYHKIKSFWLVMEPGYKGLYFQTTGRFPRLINVGLGEQNPVTVREVLSGEVTEEVEHGERFMDMLARKMKL